MNDINYNLTVGLFGTCGDTVFRETMFIPFFEENNIPYFNPQVKEWDPSMAKLEAEHLANDGAILFPITRDTYSLGSLAEAGFSILNAIKLDDRRDFVILIDDDLMPDLMEDKNLAKESLRSRALVKQHLLKLNFSNVYLVNTLSTMLGLSKSLWEARASLENWKKYSLKNH